MKACVLIVLSLVVAVLASMTLAIYLPVLPVERMFIAGLSVPVMAPVFLLGLLFLSFRIALITLLTTSFLLLLLLVLGVY